MIIGMAFESQKEILLADKHYQELEKKLVAIDGRELVYMPSPTRLIRFIIDQGQTFDASTAKKVKGKPSQCHDNVTALWSKHKERYQMVHGYGLSPDGLWRQHSWLLDEHGTVLETTVPRTAYLVSS